MFSKLVKHTNEESEHVELGWSLASCSAHSKTGPYHLKFKSISIPITSIFLLTWQVGMKIDGRTLVRIRLLGISATIYPTVKQVVA
jgi:hypothetical protein